MLQFKNFFPFRNWKNQCPHIDIVKDSTSLEIFLVKKLEGNSLNCHWEQRYLAFFCIIYFILTKLLGLDTSENDSPMNVELKDQIKKFLEELVLLKIIQAFVPHMLAPFI